MLLPSLLLSVLLALTQAFFEDVTPANFHPPALKFGGPAIADLDNNGLPDLILGYHGSAPVEVYYNFDGEFVRSPFEAGGDLHAYVPFRYAPEELGLRFTISRGGSMGNYPRSAVMFKVKPGTTDIKNVTDQSGIGVRAGRGRSALYVDMSMKQGKSVPDVVYTNTDITRCPTCKNTQQHVFKNVGGGRFRPVQVPGLSKSTNSEGTVVDIDGDGVMEIIMFKPGFQIFKLVGPMEVKDITAEVLPKELDDLFNVWSVSELDFDNDGDFDLYLALGKTGRKSKLDKGKRKNDILLENRNGKFVDVSRRAGIPKQTFSFGVTAGDFDNDGYMDILLTIFDEPDILLRNRGDGTFKKVAGLIPFSRRVRGDMAQAVDYDADGRLDLIVSQGDRIDEMYAGRYLVMKNVIKGPAKKGFVLVRVGSSPARRATSLHAVVTVVGEQTYTRRVGSPGTSVSASYIELVHVGIGDSQTVDVWVRWANGETEVLTRVARGSTVDVGGFGMLSRAERQKLRRRRKYNELD